MARPGLTTHRKFRRLTRALGSRIVARGCLELLWDSSYESGDEYVGTAADIEYAVGWTGEPGVLTKALVDAGAPEGFGFLEPVGEPVEGNDAVAYRIHDLWHHAPDYVAKRRKRELDRQGKADPGRVSRTAPNGDGSGKSSTSLIEVDGTPSPSPSHSPKKNVRPELNSGQPAFLTFPIVGPGPDSWSLSEAQIAEWVELFPAVDVRGECRKAFAWLQASPGRRKTGRGMARFLVGWLGRTNDSGRGKVASFTPSTSPTPGADATAEILRAHRSAGGR